MGETTYDSMHDYKDMFSQKLQSINLPTDVLFCGAINCSNEVHFQQLNTYVTESSISAAETVIP